MYLVVAKLGYSHVELKAMSQMISEAMAENEIPKGGERGVGTGKGSGARFLLTSSASLSPCSPFQASLLILSLSLGLSCLPVHAGVSWTEQRLSMWQCVPRPSTVPAVKLTE